MGKAFLWVFSAILFLAYDICEGLDCYHCYQGKKYDAKDAVFVPCNQTDLAASNVWTCPSPKAHCLYETVELVVTKDVQVWRTCSNGISDPCDPNALPPGVKMIECSYCSTDRCNLKKPDKPEKNEFTINVNANVNLYVRN